ncbi:MAG: hypothetical protein AAFU71_01510 [Cyanobacteria bacterium J06632_22]
MGVAFNTRVWYQKLMVRVCQKPVKKNPFEAYRDPDTGRWFVKVRTVYFTNVLKPAQPGAALPQPGKLTGTLQEA